MKPESTRPQLFIPSRCPDSLNLAGFLLDPLTTHQLHFLLPSGKRLNISIWPNLGAVAPGSFIRVMHVFGEQNGTYNNYERIKVTPFLEMYALAEMERFPLRIYGWFDPKHHRAIFCQDDTNFPYKKGLLPYLALEAGYYHDENGFVPHSGERFSYEAIFGGVFEIVDMLKLSDQAQSLLEFVNLIHDFNRENPEKIKTFQANLVKAARAKKMYKAYWEAIGIALANNLDATLLEDGNFQDDLYLAFIERAKKEGCDNLIAVFKQRIAEHYKDGRLPLGLVAANLVVG